MGRFEAAEIAELAWCAQSRRAFRDEIVRRLRAEIGFEGGWFHTLDPSLPLDTGCWDALELRWIERARAGWGTYAPGLARLRVAMSASRGVAQDSDVYGAGERERIGFFTDVVRPLGMKHILWTELRLAGRDLAVIGLARSDGGRAFAHKSQELMRRLVPALALAEALLEARAPDGRDPALTARERAVLELFALGATYDETARALGITINTVRVYVRSIYDKLHVASKVEAVMKARAGR